MNILKCHLLHNKYEFLDSGSYLMDGITALNDHLLYYELMISIVVAWLLVIILWKNSFFILKDLVHGSVLEIIWTLIPGFILILIALPSFRLLYLMDDLLEPSLSIKVIGFISGLIFIISFFIHFLMNLIDIFCNCDNTEILMSFILPTTRSTKRISPHNKYTLSIIFGSLLGDGYANKRSGEGIRICYR